MGLEATTKGRIFAAARDLFDRQGVEGVSMRRIAQVVALTPMAIYRHYADKDALLDALMLDGFMAWEARVAAIQATEPLAWLGQLGVAYMEFALGEPRRFEAAFLLPAQAARRYPGDFAAGRSPVISMAMAHIERAKAAGLITGEPLEIALSFAALAQGLVSMYRAGRFADETKFRTAYEKAMAHCLRSFMTDGQGR
ncbi:MAG TPA: TetR/AcrR family transcriptional regulator [Rhizomicrobium sp.]|jgi:AcrR family transcriptional regulator